MAEKASSFCVAWPAEANMATQRCNERWRTRESAGEAQKKRVRPDFHASRTFGQRFAPEERQGASTGRCASIVQLKFNPKSTHLMRSGTSEPSNCAESYSSVFQSPANAPRPKKNIHQIDRFTLQMRSRPLMCPSEGHRRCIRGF